MNSALMAAICMTVLTSQASSSPLVVYFPEPNHLYEGYTAQLYGSWKPMAFVGGSVELPPSKVKRTPVLGKFNNAPTFLDDKADQLAINCYVVADKSAIGRVPMPGNVKQSNPEFLPGSESIGGYECRLTVERQQKLYGSIANYEQIFLSRKLGEHQGYVVVEGEVNCWRTISPDQLATIERILSSVDVTLPPPERTHVKAGP